MKGIAELRSREVAFIHIITVAFVNHDTIGHLHDTTLNPLQFISRSRQLDKQEEMIKNLMESMKWSAEQAMTAMKVSDADRAMLLEKL